SSDPVVALQELTPTPVANLGEMRRRRDQVGEQDRRENPVAALGPPRTREELLNLIQDRVGVTDPRNVILSRKLDEGRARHLGGNPSPFLHSGVPIAGA